MICTLDTNILINMVTRVVRTVGLARILSDGRRAETHRLAHQPQPGAVDQVHPLAGPQPAHAHRVARLGARQGQDVAGDGARGRSGGLEGVDGEDEDGGGHGPSLRSGPESDRVGPRVRP